MAHFSGGHAAGDPYPVGTVRLLVETVIGQFVDHIKEDENTGGKADGQPENIDQCISPVFPEVPECNDDVTSEHTEFLYIV